MSMNGMSTMNTELELESLDEKELDDAAIDSSIVDDCKGYGKDVVFFWRDQPSVPYADPFEEYCASPHLLDATALKMRWTGLAEPAEIDAMFLKPFLFIERETCQQNLLSKMGFNAGDPNFKATLNNITVARVMSRMARIEAILDENEISDFEMVDVMSDIAPEVKTGIRHMNTFKRPLKVREISQLNTVLTEQAKLLRLLTEQATEIQQSTVNVEVSMVDSLRESLKKYSPEYAELLAIANGQLPPPSHNGEDSNGHNGRLIDVTNETEIR